MGSWSGCTGRAIEFGVSVKGGRGRVRLRRGRVGWGRGRVGAGRRVGSFGERGIRGRGFGEGRFGGFGAGWVDLLKVTSIYDEITPSHK